MEALWNEVDEYFGAHLVGSDEVLDNALADCAAHGLPSISVTPLQGKLLALLARVGNARRILEIGTLGGYSAIWMGRVLPQDGELLTLEIEPAHAAVAERNIARAGLADRVRIMLGPAASSLAALTADHVPPFDLIFIDADKESSDLYCRAALELSHVGTMIVVDNVVRDGKVADASSADEAIQGIRRMTAMIATEPRLWATAIQTVGSKGHDGFLMAMVVAEP